MIRRWHSTGRYRQAAPLADVPLLAAALSTRRLKSKRRQDAAYAMHRGYRERCLAVAAGLRAEMAAERVAF